MDISKIKFGFSLTIIIIIHDFIPHAIVGIKFV
jgi:hypothetical protein